MRTHVFPMSTYVRQRTLGLHAAQAVGVSTHGTVTAPSLKVAGAYSAAAQLTAAVELHCAVRGTPATCCWLWQRDLQNTSMGRHIYYYY
jgi:hypothetical protein